jgi:hypothetical protein
MPVNAPAPVFDCTAAALHGCSRGGPCQRPLSTMVVLGPRLGLDFAMLSGVICSAVVIFAYGQHMFWL